MLVRRSREAARSAGSHQQQHVVVTYTAQGYMRCVHNFLLTFFHTVHAFNEYPHTPKNNEWI